MKSVGDRQGSKLIILFLIVIFFYLAFFNFNIERAWDYTFSANAGLLQTLGF